MPDMDLDTRQPLHSHQLLLEIPLEIRLDISSYLSLSDVANLRAASRQLERELYDLFIRLFVQTPALRRWRAIPVAGLKIPWTEDALKRATFILGINGNAEHVKKLHFVAYDDTYTREEHSLHYGNSDRYGQKSTDYAESRRQLVATESRCAGLLEFIWRRTTNATAVVLETTYDVPIMSEHMDLYQMAELYDPLLDIDLLYDVAEIRECGDEVSVQDYLESERLIFASESFSQAFAMLVEQISKGVKEIGDLLIRAPVERTDRPTDLNNKGPAREFSNLGASLTKLRSFEYGVDCVDYEYSNKLLNATGRPKPLISSLLSAMASVQDFGLGSCSSYNVITPRAVGSALSAFSSTCLSKLSLFEAVVSRNDLLRFLGRYQSSLQELYLYNVCLIHGGWGSLLNLIKRRKLKGCAQLLFELCKSENFAIMFERTSARSARRPCDDTLCFDQNNSFRTRRYERGPCGRNVKSTPKQRRLLEMLPPLRMFTIQWAGAYFANELDETLDNTNEIRTWE